MLPGLKTNKQTKSPSPKYPSAMCGVEFCPIIRRGGGCRLPQTPVSHIVLLLLCPSSKGAALDGKVPAHLRGEEPACDCGKGCGCGKSAWF